MHSGSLPSLVHPIDMSVQPGSLKTAFYITAYNENGFNSVLSKCQSSFNDLLSARAHTHKHTHTQVVFHACVCVSCNLVQLFSALLAFSGNPPFFISLSAINSLCWSNKFLYPSPQTLWSRSPPPMYIHSPVTWSHLFALIKSTVASKRPV